MGMGGNGELKGNGSALYCTKLMFASLTVFAELQ